MVTNNEHLQVQWMMVQGLSFPLLAKENVDHAAWRPAHSSAAETRFDVLMGWTPRFII